MAQQLGSNYYNTPYKFNGKELDEETGFYYYGARYYDPRVSFWMSIDPLAEKYKDNSPYIYCKQNPINIIDPDGRYLFGLFGSTASERRLARAEKFASKVGGSVHINELSGKPSVNYDAQSTSDGGVSFKFESRFGDFSSWKNVKQTLIGFDRALEGSSDGTNSGGYYGGIKGRDKFIEDSSDTSTYIKITGLAVAATGDIPMGIAIYDVGENVDKASTGLQIIKDFTNKKIGSAVTRLVSEVATGKVDAIIDKSIKNEARKLGLKAGSEKIIESVRDSVVKKTD